VISAAAILCLALNIYHEARGEPFISQVGVAAITINRTQAKGFPKSGVCGVVNQPHAFSWTSIKHPKVRDQKALKASLYLARRVLDKKQDISLFKGRLYFNHKDLGKRRHTTYAVIKAGHHYYY
jgi:N-acetylmuramoyl-L-alanine amidase